MLNYSHCKFDDFVFIGMRGHSYPGKVKSRAFRRHKLALEKMFNKFRKENKNRKVIFLAHICPYKTRLDLITAKDAHKKARGKHYGSKLARRIIDKFQPVLFIGGHFEEAMGIQKLGKTLCVNNGSIHHGKGVIVDIQGKNIKVKLIK